MLMYERAIMRPSWSMSEVKTLDLIITFLRCVLLLMRDGKSFLCREICYHRAWHRVEAMCLADYAKLIETFSNCL